MHNYVCDDLNFHFDFDFLPELYFNNVISNESKKLCHLFLHFFRFSKKKKNRKNKVQADQLMGYADSSFIIFLCSYSVKSHYFSIILNRLGLLSCKSMTIVGFTMQISSIVTEKRGGKRRTKHRTGIM